MMSANDAVSKCCVCDYRVSPGEGRIVGKSPGGGWISAHERCIDASFVEAEDKAKDQPKAEAKPDPSAIPDEQLDKLIEAMEGHVEQLHNLLKDAENRRDGLKLKRHDRQNKKQKAEEGPPRDPFRGKHSTWGRGTGRGSFYDFAYNQYYERSQAESSPFGSAYSSGFSGAATGTAPTPECLRVFGLSAGATKDQVNARFREMAKSKHPDKGGSPKEFIHLQRARDEALKTCRN